MLRIGQNIARLAAFDFGEAHRDDRRFLNDRKSERAHERRHRLFLIRLNIEEENVRLIVAVDGAELRQQHFAA